MKEKLARFELRTLTKQSWNCKRMTEAPLLASLLMALSITFLTVLSACGQVSEQQPACRLIAMDAVNRRKSSRWMAAISRLIDEEEDMSMRDWRKEGETARTRGRGGGLLPAASSLCLCICSLRELPLVMVGWQRHASANHTTFYSIMVSEQQTASSKIAADCFNLFYLLPGVNFCMLSDFLGVSFCLRKYLLVTDSFSHGFIFHR